MAIKKIGIYGEFTSTANNKVEDLFIVIENEAIHFLVKNIHNDTFIAFESFEINLQKDTAQSLMSFLQRHSKLILAYYRLIKFVNNQFPIALTKKSIVNDPSIHTAELQLFFGNLLDREVVTNDINDNTEIIYTVPNAIQTLLTTMFPSGKWVHYVQYFIEIYTKAGVYLQMFDDFALCVIRDENNLLLTKYINSPHPSDYMYTIMQSIEQLDCKLYDFDLLITGANEEASSLFSPFSKYTASLQFIKSKDKLLGAAFEAEQGHPFYHSYLIF